MSGSYGEGIALEVEQEIQYPDFTVVFKGKRDVPNPAFKTSGKFVYYDFEITSPDSTQTVSWTSGTGNIAPRNFSVDDHNYALVLDHHSLLVVDKVESKS